MKPTVEGEIERLSRLQRAVLGGVKGVHEEAIGESQCNNAGLLGPTRLT
jgi:hypothetical protein